MKTKIFVNIIYKVESELIEMLELAYNEEDFNLAFAIEMELYKRSGYY